jgi:hypothetical protein
MFMYAWGIFFTLFSIYFFAPELVAKPSIIIEIFHNEPLLPWIVLTNAFMGILDSLVPLLSLSSQLMHVSIYQIGFSTSLLLRDMNVLYKEYANFAEMLVLVAGTWLAFGTVPNMVLIPATAIVCGSLYMYNMEASRLDELRASQPKPVPTMAAPLDVPLTSIGVAPARSD